MPHYTIIIDKSLSMYPNLEELGDNVIEFIDKIKEYDDKARGKIVLFDDSTGSIWEFSVLETGGDTRAKPDHLITT